MPAYRYSRTVRLQDTDAAGILFFANWFIFAHEAYEKMMEDIGLGFARLFETEPYIIPIVHAEADYERPLGVGDEIEVELTVADIGTTSFTLEYVLRTRDGQTAGACRTVHVAMDKKSKEKIQLPDKLRQGLSGYCAD
jgi:YbgC/YbaW family acyl-CoA thioester hydrolase